MTQVPPAFLRALLLGGAVASITMGQCDDPSTVVLTFQRPLRDALLPSQDTAAIMIQCYYRGPVGQCRVSGRDV